jgi:hypothetical protein
MKSLLVCGGRDFQDEATLSAWMKCINPTMIMHGGAAGADNLANKIANENDWPVAVFAANWDMEGRSAGPRRNERMLAQLLRESATFQVLALAMPGGTGTRDMVTRAQSAGVPVFGPEHRAFIEDEPRFLLETTALSLRRRQQLHAEEDKELRSILKHFLGHTQNTGHYPGTPVPEELWNSVRALLGSDWH